MQLTLAATILALALALPCAAQFQFFEQMFNAGGHGSHGQPKEPANVASDSTWYQQNYENAHCTNYLCPGTLSCVHFPHHCPCAFPAVEDKVELGEGIAICASKGGWMPGEAARKIELARKGVL
ncbi:long chronological lifespan protein 2 [Saccharata proteae CBS 121410]|uniref:Long chronological lifespan protein 2 n=1 Tax=Saccharata proteae CBS 121410 TaxID=1314787 RepID=A0A9P4HMY6_9PEZI|nr:long chronological lifespan protein 2 [Saccharata proteae CBS 121410]